MNRIIDEVYSYLPSLQWNPGSITITITIAIRHYTSIPESIDLIIRAANMTFLKARLFAQTLIGFTLSFIDEVWIIMLILNKNFIDISLPQMKKFPLFFFFFLFIAAKTFAQTEIQCSKEGIICCYDEQKKHGSVVLTIKSQF